MADKEKHAKHPNEWEVVSLTSSAYAASPGLYNSRDAYYGAENSRDLFMSDHFVFPPSQHENLPLDEEERKNGQGLMLEAQGLSEKSIYAEAALSSSQHMVYEHGLTDSDRNEYADVDLDPRGLEKDGKKATNDLPWWRRRAVSVYLRTREANAVWSLFFAAAVTGLVVLGQRWQQERWQVLQLNWHSSITSEKLSRVLEPISRLKDVIVRGSPQASLVRSGTSSEM
ncbi:ATG8-interacting protein 1 [Hirschfeldia incana]|nr:ATG8-interacting protein 1 [Hirschfeldia incana]